MSQLRCYLSATDTQFGVLAISIKPNLWSFCENHRNNWFSEITQDIFEDQVSRWCPEVRDVAHLRDLQERCKKPGVRRNRESAAAERLQSLSVYP